MRISDWSSDVCSSDLLCCRWCTHFVKYVTLRGLTLSNLGNARQAFVRLVGDVRMRRARGSAFLSEINPTAGPIATGRREQLTQGDRKSVVEGKSVSVRVDLGGRRSIKKKTTK